MYKKFRHRLILLIITLSLLITSYEILLTWQRYPMATIDTSELSNMKRYFEHQHVELPNHPQNKLEQFNDFKHHVQFDTKRSQSHLQYVSSSMPQVEKDSVHLEREMTNRRTLKQLLSDPDMKQLPVKVELDCTEEMLQFSRSTNDDIVCINETQLWGDMLQRGIDVNALSDRQRKAALVRAVLAHLERNDFEDKDEASDLEKGERIGDTGFNRQHQGYEVQIAEPKIQVKQVLDNIDNDVDTMYELQQQNDDQPFEEEIGQKQELTELPVRESTEVHVKNKLEHHDGIETRLLDGEIDKKALQVDQVGRESDDSKLQMILTQHKRETEFKGQNKDGEIHSDWALGIENDDVLNKMVHRLEQELVVDDAQDKKLDKQVLFQLDNGEQVSVVDTVDKGARLSTNEHAPIEHIGTLKITTERAQLVNNGRYRVSSERAPAVVDNNKAPKFVQQYDNLDQLEGDYHDNNEDLFEQGQKDIPQWIPHDFVNNRENLEYYNKVGEPLQPEPLSDVENVDNLMENDPLNSVLAPLGHNPRKNARKRGASLVAKKRKQSAKKLPTDYYLGLSDKDRSASMGNGNSNFNPNQVSPNSSKVNLTNHSNQSTVSKWHHNESDALRLTNKALNVSKTDQNESNALPHKASGGLIQMNRELYQLVGSRLPVNYDLRARHLPTKFNPTDPQMMDRLKYLNEALEESDPMLRSVTSNSLNPDLLRRAKFQQSQTKVFCSQNHMDSNLPSDPDELDTLFQHLLYDDSRRLIFCYVPKNGCSNMKRMMLVLNGILPPESVNEKRPAENVLKQVHSFRNLTLQKALYKLRHYYKAIIVRNPMERLVSAYRNKLEPPLNYTTRRHFPDRLKAYILRKYNKRILDAWLDYGNYSIDIHPSFSDFLQFMTKFPLRFYNEHFKPALELCFPCAMHYDYYINFKSMEYDIYALMHFLGIPFEYYPTFVSHPQQRTSEFVESYFGGVAAAEKVKLYEVFSQELEFYYSLYPEEWGMHKGL